MESNGESKKIEKKNLKWMKRNVFEIEWDSGW